MTQAVQMQKLRKKFPDDHSLSEAIIQKLDRLSQLKEDIKNTQLILTTINQQITSDSPSKDMITSYSEALLLWKNHFISVYPDIPEAQAILEDVHATLEATEKFLHDMKNNPVLLAYQARTQNPQALKDFQECLTANLAERLQRKIFLSFIPNGKDILLSRGIKTISCA